MTESTNKQVKVKGFQPKAAPTGSQSQVEPDVSTDHPSSANPGDTVITEVAQLSSEVFQSLEGQRRGLNNLRDEYMQEAAELRKTAKYEIYDMLSGHGLYRAIAADVGELMSAHPTERKAPLSLGKTQLKRVYFEPWKPGTTDQSLLSASDEEASK